MEIQEIPRFPGVSKVAFHLAARIPGRNVRLASSKTIRCNRVSRVDAATFLTDRRPRVHAGCYKRDDCTWEQHARPLDLACVPCNLDVTKAVGRKRELRVTPLT